MADKVSKFIFPVKNGTQITNKEFDLPSGGSVTVDDALSDTSKNPVQNKIVKAGLDGKSNTSHNHDDRYYTEAEENQIIETLNNADIQKIERNGTTFTVTRNDGTTFTFSQQDNNTTYSNGTGLNLSGTTFSVKYGTDAGTACQGNDSRLSNSRTPTSHASTGTGYGAGNASYYGHVKVSDNYTSSAGNASQSVAASSAAVYNAYAAAIKSAQLTGTLNNKFNGNHIMQCYATGNQYSGAEQYTTDSSGNVAVKNGKWPIFVLYNSYNGVLTCYNYGGYFHWHLADWNGNAAANKTFNVSYLYLHA